MLAFLGGLGIGELIVIFIILGFFMLLPIIALVDVIRSEFRNSNDKLIWVLVILFLNVIGAALYLIIGRNQLVS